MTDIIEDSFHLVMIVLRFGGLYHKGEKSIFWKMWTYFAYLCALFLPLLVFAKLMVEESIDSQEIAFMVIFLVQTSSSCLKIIPFLVDPERMKKCMEFFGQKQFGARDQDEEEILSDCVNTCRLLAKIYYSAVLLTAVLWILLPLFATERKFPVTIWLPYDTSSPLVFYVTYFYIAAGTFYLALVGESVEPLVAGLAYLARSHFKILKNNLELSGKSQNETIGYGQVTEILKNCVQHHDKILTFCKEFESSFSWCIFCQIAASIFGLCFSCIGLTLVPFASVDAATYAQSYLIMSLQILFYCYFGTVLFEENEQLITSIYMGFWYKCDVRIRKVLIMIMERAKDPVNINAGKIIELNLATFTSVLKMSYSLIAVMNKQ